MRKNNQKIIIILTNGAGTIGYPHAEKVRLYHKLLKSIKQTRIWNLRDTISIYVACMDWAALYLPVTEGWHKVEYVTFHSPYSWILYLQICLLQYHLFATLKPLELSQSPVGMHWLGKCSAHSRWGQIRRQLS